MTTPIARLRRAPARLGVRLALLLSVALLPVGLIAVMQSISLLDEARARSEAALMGETLMIAQTELRLIQRGQGMAAAVAGETWVIPENGRETVPPEACARLLPMVRSQLVEQADVAIIAANGQVICPPTIELDDLSGTALFEKLMSSGEPDVILDNAGLLGKGSAVVISHPIMAPSQRRDAEGVVQAVVSIVVPHMALHETSSFPAHELPVPMPESQGAAILTFNAQGEVLTSSRGLEGAQGLLPRNRALKALVGSRPLTFTARSANGLERVYSVVPLIEQNLYALGTWPGEGNRIRAMDTLPAAMFPALMWAASLIVGWLAAGQLVTRHVRRLRGAISAFAGGDRAVRPIDVSGAPLELRELSDAFVRMTDTILHDEAELENAVHQKEVLLRELHHRVKNNLQLIASILNMQVRQARSPEAKWLMKGVRDRVMSLATIHRGLYQTSGLTDIRADELLSDIARQLVNMATGPGRRLSIEQNFEPVRLTPDQAVPLSLFLTEALTNAMKYADQDGEDLPYLTITLKRLNDTRVILRVANSVGTLPRPETDLPGDLTETTGLGAQLLEAFSQQIGGEMHREESAGHFSLTLEFTLAALTEAEARNMPDDPQDAPRPVEEF
ncbi:MAG: sensor histidine kinase [Rhodobacterales bacterium]|nr:sensor histidine kinase [Rhodobacterales bacterium]MDX5412380.1 sensor histidine kinase [Rhodobacterales bacterium]